MVHFVIHSSISRHLGCFHILVSVNMLLWTEMCKYFFEILLSVLLDTHLEVELLGPMEDTLFWRMALELFIRGWWSSLPPLERNSHRSSLGEGSYLPPGPQGADSSYHIPWESKSWPNHFRIFRNIWKTLLFGFECASGLMLGWECIYP